jgi:hypothetical protein
MGSTVILVGAVALGTGLVCLFCGFLWGRSNVRSQIEDALDQSRISADAREYSVREELDDKMLELSELRARAEELPRLRQQIEQLQSEKMRGVSSSNSNAYGPGNNPPIEQKLPEKAQEPAPVQESADKAIQNLLNSIEERMKQTEEDPRAIPQQRATPPVTELAVEIPPTITQLSSKPALAAPAAKPASAAKDEWQEFAASLAALKSRQK